MQTRSRSRGIPVEHRLIPSGARFWTAIRPGAGASFSPVATFPVLVGGSSRYRPRCCPRKVENYAKTGESYRNPVFLLRLPLQPAVRRTKPGAGPLPSIRPFCQLFVTCHFQNQMINPDQSGVCGGVALRIVNVPTSGKVLGMFTNNFYKGMEPPFSASRTLLENHHEAGQRHGCDPFVQQQR